jgi:hypothetical protein
MRHLAIALAVLCAAPAAAAGPLAQAPTAGAATAYPDLPPPPPPVAPEAERWPALGLRLDLGVPDGAVAALVYRPAPSVRLSGGLAWTSIAWGYQLGVGLTPFRWAVSPTFNVDYGHFFDGDATFIARQDGVPPELEPLLRRVGYDYVSGLVGLEVGSPRGFSFSLKAGLSYLWTRIRGASESLQSTSGGDAVVRLEDPRLRATLPTVKLGLLFYF